MAFPIAMFNAFKIAYDGRLFNGSARQPDQRTVEGGLLRGLKDMGAIDGAGERTMRFSSRTDKGVSALANMFVVDTRLDGETVIKGMNGSFRQDGIWFLCWNEVQPDLKPRHAERRWYRYAHSIEPGLAPGEFVIDEKGMREVAALFKGEHDFRNFSKFDRKAPEKTTMRTVFDVDITLLTVNLTSQVHGSRPGTKLPFEPPMFQEVLLIDVHGQSFLWQMVRRMAAAIVAVGTKKISVEKVEDVLKGRSRDDLGVLPPHGLTLMDVDHGFEYKYPEDVWGTVLDLQRNRGWPQINRGMFYGQLIFNMLEPVFR